MRSLFALCLLTAGCADAPWRHKGSDTDPTDDRPPQQAESCARWLECVAATEPDRLSDEQALYGEGAPCWGDARSAADCEAACDEALEEAFLQYPQEPACDTGKTYRPDEILQSGTEWVLESYGTDACEDYPQSFLHHASGHLTLLAGDAFRLDFHEAILWGEGPYNEEGGGQVLCTFDFPFFTCEGSFDGPLGYGYEWATTMEGAFEPPYDNLLGTVRILVEQRCWIETVLVGYMP